VIAGRSPEHGSVTPDTSAIRRLDRWHCLVLMGSKDRARVALSDRALPVIVPVLYRIEGTEIVLPSCRGIVAAAAAGGHVVCFQTDVVDPDSGIAWSIVATGRLTARAWGATGSVTASLDTTSLTGYGIDDLTGPA